MYVNRNIVRQKEKKSGEKKGLKCPVKLEPFCGWGWDGRASSRKTSVKKERKKKRDRRGREHSKSFVMIG